MPDRLDPMTWPRARVTARQLREALAARGIPADILRQIVPVGDMQGRQYVRLGTWSVGDADRLLAALAEHPAPTDAES